VQALLRAAMLHLPARSLLKGAHATAAGHTRAVAQTGVARAPLRAQCCKYHGARAGDSLKQQQQSLFSSSCSPNEVPADCRDSSVQDGLQEDVHGVLGANGTSTQLQENSRPAQPIRSHAQTSCTPYSGYCTSQCAGGCVLDSTLQMLVCCMSTLVGAQVKAQGVMRTARRSMGQEQQRVTGYTPC
jgi:hypothetical protein